MYSLVKLGELTPQEKEELRKIVQQHAQYEQMAGAGKMDAATQERMRHNTERIQHYRAKAKDSGYQIPGWARDPMGTPPAGSRGQAPRPKQRQYSAEDEAWRAQQEARYAKDPRKARVEDAYARNEDWVDWKAVGEKTRQAKAYGEQRAQEVGNAARNAYNTGTTRVRDAWASGKVPWKTIGGLGALGLLGGAYMLNRSKKQPEQPEQPSQPYQPQQMRQPMYY